MNLTAAAADSVQPLGALVAKKFFVFAPDTNAGLVAVALRRGTQLRVAEHAEPLVSDGPSVNSPYNGRLIPPGGQTTISGPLSRWEWMAAEEGDQLIVEPSGDCACGH